MEYVGFVLLYFTAKIGAGSGEQIHAAGEGKVHSRARKLFSMGRNSFLIEWAFNPAAA